MICPTFKERDSFNAQSTDLLNVFVSLLGMIKKMNEKLNIRINIENEN